MPVTICQSAVGGSHWCYFTSFGCHIYIVPRVDVIKGCLSPKPTNQVFTFTNYSTMVVPKPRLCQEIQYRADFKTEATERMGLSDCSISSHATFLQHQERTYIRTVVWHRSNQSVFFSLCWKLFMVKICMKQHSGFQLGAGTLKGGIRGLLEEERQYAELLYIPLEGAVTYPSTCNPFIEKTLAFLQGEHSKQGQQTVQGSLAE